MCAQEAPHLEQFARASMLKVKVVGIGALDTLGDAQRFNRVHGHRAIRMLYDPSARAWNHFGVIGQPAGVLIDPTGKVLKFWDGPVDHYEAQQLLAAKI